MKTITLEKLLSEATKAAKKAGYKVIEESSNEVYKKAKDATDEYFSHSKASEDAIDYYERGFIRGWEAANEEKLSETTCAGGIASVAMPLGSVQKRKPSYP
jgi:hypothetical protein